MGRGAPLAKRDRQEEASARRRHCKSIAAVVNRSRTKSSPSASTRWSTQTVRDATPCAAEPVLLGICSATGEISSRSGRRASGCRHSGYGLAQAAGTYRRAAALVEADGVAALAPTSALATAQPAAVHQNKVKTRPVA